MKPNRKGFTILELLVVVAIIAILAVISIPNFIGRIDEAKVSQELAEINAVGKAINTYYADNGVYPTLQGKDGSLLQTQPILGSPHNVDFSSLVPDYLSTLPHFSYWWVDYEGKIYHTQESLGTVTAGVFTPTAGYTYTLYKADGSKQVLSAPYTLQAGDYVTGVDDKGVNLPKVSSSFKNAKLHPQDPEYVVVSEPVLPSNFTANLFPTTGTASASSFQSSDYPSNAFDNSFNDAGYSNSNWDTGLANDRWISFEFASAKKINKYVIHQYNPTLEGYHFHTWRFEAWSGSAWVVLDENNDATLAHAKRIERSFINNTTYKLYRLYIVTGRAVLDELEMMEGIN